MRRRCEVPHCFQATASGTPNIDKKPVGRLKNRLGRSKLFFL
jgi:hypothetical protein